MYHIFVWKIEKLLNTNLFFFFDEKITWQLHKINKKAKTERVSNWIDAQSSCLGFTSFNIPPTLVPETTDELLL